MTDCALTSGDLVLPTCACALVAIDPALAWRECSALATGDDSKEDGDDEGEMNGESEVDGGVEESERCSSTVGCRVSDTLPRRSLDATFASPVHESSFDRPALRLGAFMCALFVWFGVCAPVDAGEMEDEAPPRGAAAADQLIGRTPNEGKERIEEK